MTALLIFFVLRSRVLDSIEYLNLQDEVSLDAKSFRVFYM
jgi:hypothetical protein